MAGPQVVLPDDDPVAPDSPRASMARYLGLCRRQRWVDAGRFLDVPRARAAEGAVLARELYDVLDRFVGVDPEGLSAASMGDPDDGLPPRVDEVGRIPEPDAPPRPVRMVRRDEPDGARWVFTRDTVVRVDGWYARLGGHWAREHLPPWMLRRGPRDLLVWQWLGLLAVMLASWSGGQVLGWLTRAVFVRAARRSEGLWRTVWMHAAAPLTAAWMLALVSLGTGWLALYRAADEFVHQVLRAGVYCVAFASLWQATEVLAQGLTTMPWARNHPSSVTLIPLGTRFIKVLVGVMAVIAVLSQLGYPVASLLAGLGIGGLALALAAQKTGEHLLGSIAIGVDQPFRVGDFIKVDDIRGTVESVGLRSTQIRTQDRTVVTVPNGKLADLRIETFAPRDRIRLACTLALQPGTTADQVRAVIAGVRDAVTAHPEVWPQGVSVALTAIHDAALEIEVLAWFRTTDWDHFVVIRQELLLGFLDVIERAGTGLAHSERWVRRTADNRPG